MRARTGARTMCSVSASAVRISSSDSGSTSQKVRVQSNGVCATAQKLAYVRSLFTASSGTIVKLICLRSDMQGSLPDRSPLTVHRRPLNQPLTVDRLFTVQGAGLRSNHARMWGRASALQAQCVGSDATVSLNADRGWHPDGERLTVN